MKHVLWGLVFVSSLSFAGSQEAELEKLKEKGAKYGWTFEVGETSISKMTAKEFTGLKTPKGWKKLAPWISPNQEEMRVPAKWDWREHNVVTPIKDQAKPQYCGSCWAFGSVAIVESAVAIATGKMLDLSEQQLVSCQPSYGTCSGGYFAMGFYKNKGAAYETDFPYLAKNASCKSGLPQNEKVQNWAYVGNAYYGSTVEQMKAAIYKYGPIAVTVSASGAWKYYKSGVYNECNSNAINHIVALVGWNDDEQAWIMKNSHGTEWGEAGYMRIRYKGTNGSKCNNVGQSAAVVMYP
jgi:C1A family cysteine protease